MLVSKEMKKTSLVDEVKRFWEPNGVLESGERAYVKSFRDAVEADRCVSDLADIGLLNCVRIEQAITDIGYTAVRLDGEQFDRAFAK